MQQTERDEGGAHARLLRAQRELAEARGVERLAQVQTYRAPRLLLAPVERFGGDGRGLAHAQEQSLARLRLKLGGERGAEEDFACARRACLRALDAVELPEPFVHAVDLHASRPAPALFLRDAAFQDDERARVFESGRREPGVRLDLVGESLAEEGGGGDDRVSTPEPLQEQRAQARAHAVADDERAGQHRDAHRDARHDGEVRPPVVSETAFEKR